MAGRPETKVPGRPVLFVCHTNVTVIHSPIGLLPRRFLVTLDADVDDAYEEFTASFRGSAAIFIRPIG